LCAQNEESTTTYSATAVLMSSRIDIHLLLYVIRLAGWLKHFNLSLQVAAPFDVEQLQRQYPATYQESMNTVLVQEALRYNALLEVVAASLKECGKAVKGLVVMSPSLEAVSNSMYDNQVQSRYTLAIYTHGHVVRIAAQNVSTIAPTVASQTHQRVTCFSCQIGDCGDMTGSTCTSCKALAHAANKLTLLKETRPSD